MAKVSLLVGGREYIGWKSVRITRSIEAIAGSFDLSVSDRWNGQESPWPIYEGEECAVEIEGARLISGYVDKRSLRYSAGERSIGVRGRDKTGDLVDCSVVLGKWEFAGVRADRIISKIAGQFGIPVSVASGVSIPAPQDKFSIDPGETAFNAIEKLCKLSGLLPVSDGAGGLILTRGGATARATSALVEGVNILSADGEYSHEQRFARYIVTGQHIGSDTNFGEQVASVEARSADPAVRSGRVLMVQEDAIVTLDAAQRRANWEAAVRAARATPATIVVQGWQQQSGALWPVNALVRVTSPWLGVDSDMLICEATYSLDLSTGTRTELKLKRPDAFLPEISVPKKGKKGVSGPWAELQ